MKKKLLALVSMITCIFALTACGEEPNYTEFEQAKLRMAESTAEAYVSLFAYNFCQGSPFSDFGLPLDELTMNDIKEVVYQATQGSYEVEGYAVVTGVASFNSALEEMGGLVGVTDSKATFDGNQIVVNVDVEGANKNATAEIVLSNDLIMTLESASMSPKASMGELMQKAGLNTLIGMGTVFIVLILISLIISLFAFIPKIQASVAKRKEAKKAVNESADAEEAPVVETVDETDDLELVAVIAAAIAASENAASTDGFVVRSIRRRY